MPFGDNGEKDKEWASKGGIAKAAIYELDKQTEDKWRTALSKDADRILKIQEQEEITPQDEKKLAILQARILKIMDKLHITRTATDITTKGESINVNPKTLEIAKKYEKELKETL